MAKLVIGTNKQTVVPAVVRDMSPEIYRVFRVNNGKIENSISTPFLPLPNTATDIGNYCFAYCYQSAPSSVLSGAIDLSSLTTISGNSACYYMFQYCNGITSVDLSSVVTLSGTSACSSMFASCASITTIDLSSLTTVSGNSACYNMFEGCSGIMSADLSSLTTISGVSACSSMFSSCTSLTSVNLSSLTTITGGSCCTNMFNRCTSLTSVNLSSLTTITGGSCCTNMFSNCSSLSSLSFPALTSNSFGTIKNQVSNIINSVTGCTIHFPSNLDPQSGSTVISSLTGYPNFGGINTVLSFDLPATE